MYSSQLHAFSDGSKDAFAGTIYLSFHSAAGISTSLVTSKMRVAPLDIKSIPRLELLGTSSYKINCTSEKNTWNFASFK